VLARSIEETGIPTVAVVFIKEHAARVKPPRVLWVPFPYGYALGRPNSPKQQTDVIRAALTLLNSVHIPIIEEYSENSDLPTQLVQSSMTEKVVRKGKSAADEITALRGYYERWIQENNGRTLVGLSGVPQRQFRGLVRFMEAYLEDLSNSYEKIPPGMEVGRFLRLAADDLKAFYIEARFCQRPEHTDNDLHNWFWGETSMGELLTKVAKKLESSGDERNSQGIAR
tara:strand:- start:8078 stop:8758 length:681 start_codon:yes stop_codon:yes gene_type:complete